MQEEVLSRRLLVFINGQVYFRCPVGDVSEARNWSSHCVESPGSPVSLYSTLLKDPKQAFCEFGFIITYYTSRKLSYQTDALSAAYGMLHKLTIVTGSQCFEGLWIYHCYS